MRLHAALLALLLAPLAPRAETVTVFAAASLRDAVEALARPFEAATGHRVVASYAASNALARQLEAGAPAQVFISADREWADYVESRGLALAGARRTLAGNELVLVAPKASRVELSVAPGLDLAGHLGKGRLALANPEAVPAGRYAKAALQSLGAWDAVKGRLAPAESVRAALAFVSRGEAPLGIVYRTDAIADPSVRVVGVFPPASHPRIVYPLLVLKNATPAGRSFAQHLAGDAARATWIGLGFTAP
jgi:molybdate transport system substrate-binding protein